MYRYRYINKHFQFGRTSYTLLLEDLEGILPSIRIEKEFSLDPNQIDEDFLFQEAKKDITVAQQAYNDSLVDESVGED